MEALLRELWQLREIQELAQLMESGGGPALVTVSRSACQKGCQ